VVKAMQSEADSLPSSGDVIMLWCVMKRVDCRQDTNLGRDVQTASRRRVDLATVSWDRSGLCCVWAASR
jgi:hypothetical protein